jgi:CHRD domain
VVPLSAECQEAEDSGATGFAFVSINEASGRITYHVVAFNLPGTITAAHIHGPINPATGKVPSP